MGESKKVRCSLKKWIATIVVLVVIAGIIYLTLQSPEDTGALTKTTQQYLSSFGINVGLKPLRHYIHYLLYFILGIAVCNLCVIKNWKLRIGVLLGCGIGILDECLKIWLPTREFDAFDLLRDFVGVVIAALLTMLIRKKRL